MLRSGHCHKKRQRRKSLSEPVRRKKGLGINMLPRFKPPRTPLLPKQANSASLRFCRAYTHGIFYFLFFILLLLSQLAFLLRVTSGRMVQQPRGSFWQCVKAGGLRD